MEGSVFKKMDEKIMLMKSHSTPLILANDTLHKSNFLPEVKAGNAVAINTVINELNLNVNEKNVRGWVKQNDSTENHIEFETYKIPKDLVPDVKGMGAKDAFYMLSSLGLEVRMKGRGKVIAQSLKPYSKLNNNSVIELELQ